MFIVNNVVLVILLLLVVLRFDGWLDYVLTCWRALLFGCVCF